MQQLKAAALAVAVLGCETAAGEREFESRSPIVYGSDDRREYFETSDATLRALTEEVTVALMKRSTIQRGADGYARIDAPSWRDQASLCQGERFAEEPAAAICTGTLVTDDLVLTAGHCLDAVPCSDLVAVFGYYYVAPGELRRIPNSDVVDCATVVAKHVDLPSSDVQVDYVWFQTATRRSRQAVAAVDVQPGAVPEGTAVQTISFGGGIPAKIDSGGHVADARDDVLDYFTSNLDAFHGGSGAAVYDSALHLLGVLDRGGADLVRTDDGCYRTNQEIDAPESAREQATYAFRALTGLCESDHPDPQLCGDQVPSRGRGCSIGGWTAGGWPSAFAGVALVLVARWRGNRIVSHRKRNTRTQASR